MENSAYEPTVWERELVLATTVAAALIGTSAIVGVLRRKLFAEPRARARALEEEKARAEEEDAVKADEEEEEGKPLPSIPDATTLFKLSNPELMLDPARICQEVARNMSRPSKRYKRCICSPS